MLELKIIDYLHIQLLDVVLSITSNIVAPHKGLRLTCSNSKSLLH